MNKNVIPHYDNAKMRIGQARALMIAVSSEEPVETLDPTIMVTALLGIETLIGEAEKELDRMLSAVSVGEVQA